jgi:hypothetical protein
VGAHELVVAIRGAKDGGHHRPMTDDDDDTPAVELKMSSCAPWRGESCSYGRSKKWREVREGD